MNQFHRWKDGEQVNLCHRDSPLRFGATIGIDQVPSVVLYVSRYLAIWTFGELEVYRGVRTTMADSLLQTEMIAMMEGV